MRNRISRFEMEQYLANQLSVDELREFEDRLREAGLEADVRRPNAAELLEAIRPAPYDEPFEDEVLISYVRGDLNPATAARVDMLRKIDADLEETLLTMEGAKRQVEASLQIGRPEGRVATQKSWLSFAPWGLGLAAAATLAVILLLPKTSTNGKSQPSVESVLSTTGFETVASLSPTAKAALESPLVSVDRGTLKAIASLGAPTRDTAKMTPARCMVLPTDTTRLTWNGIKAPTVDCSLLDAKGMLLAHATVTKTNGWLYRKPLPEGDYQWMAEWTGKDGGKKKAIRRFRVVSQSYAASIVAIASAAGDPISRSVVLAQNGYTYQSLQMLDQMLSRSPSFKGLRHLRDAVAKEAIL